MFKIGSSFVYSSYLLVSGFISCGVNITSVRDIFTITRNLSSLITDNKRLGTNQNEHVSELQNVKEFGTWQPKLINHQLTLKIIFFHVE
jgi:hypothetical protein